MPANTNAENQANWRKSKGHLVAVREYVPTVEQREVLKEVAKAMRLGEPYNKYLVKS